MACCGNATDFDGGEPKLIKIASSQGKKPTQKLNRRLYFRRGRRTCPHRLCLA